MDYAWTACFQCASTASVKALNMLTDFTWCPALDSERQTWKSRQLSLSLRPNYVPSCRARIKQKGATTYSLECNGAKLDQLL